MGKQNESKEEIKEAIANGEGYLDSQNNFHRTEAKKEPVVETPTVEYPEETTTLETPNTGETGGDGNGDDSPEQPITTENESKTEQIAEQITDKIQDSETVGNKNQGYTGAEAAYMADLNVAENQANTEQGIRNAVNNIDAQSQAEYLNKLGYRDQLNLTAANLQKGKDYQIVNAVLSGLSDERFKKIYDSADLQESIEAVKEETLDYTDEEIVRQLALIETVEYNYKNVEAEEIHTGITAQSLYNIPIFKKCIIDDGDFLQVDIIKATEILVNLVVPALERICGSNIVLDDNDLPVDEIDIWRLLESTISLAANIAKGIVNAE